MSRYQAATSWLMWVALLLVCVGIGLQLERIVARLDGDARYQSCMADVLNSTDDSVERMDRCRVHLPAP